MTNKDITIYDIAKQAKVSPATVSRVLTNSANVSPNKRAAVEKLIEKYNFRPNAMARGLSDTQSRVLGILVADIRNPYYAELVVACELAANERGYSVMVCNALSKPELEESNIEKLYEQRVDAIIQIGCRVDDLVSDPGYVEFVNNISSTIPFVITGKLDGTNCYRLCIDDVKAMDLVFEHLLELGHREIAFIGGSKTVYSTYMKWQRYIYLLGKNDLHMRSEYCPESDYSENGGFQCTQKLLGLSNVPTAIIAVNDMTAIGVVNALEAAGLKVPGDISVVSFDNTILSKTITPKLTTIDYNYKLFGEKLIDIAISSISSKTIAHEQWIEPALIIRQSSGAI